MIPLLYAAIDAWPGTLRSDSDRKWSPFTGTWESTSAKLRTEAAMLGAKEVTVRLALPESSLRRDGSGMREDRRGPEHPGVIVVVDTTDHGTLTFATDTFTASRMEKAWQSNVRAVALGMEALRKVERYGIADHGEQFAGWKQLGAGVAMGARPEEMTVDEAARILAGAWPPGTYTAETVLRDRDVARRSYAKAMRLLHPDLARAGGEEITAERDPILHEKIARLARAWGLVSDHHR